MKRILLLLAISTVFAASLAADWNVAPCDAAALGKRAEYRAKVRAAGPGSPLYTRIPFPRTNAEVITNLTEHFIGVYGASDGPFRAIADGMKGGAYSYEVLRVADWTPGRCAGNGNGGDSYFLIVIRDGSKKEIARASVFDTGRFRALALPDPQVKPLELPAAAQARLAARGIQARDPQLVSTWGTLACHPLRPCVASRNARGIYLVHDQDTWLLPAGGRIRSLRTELPDEAARAAFAATLKADERLVSLGADGMVVAKKAD